jgi:hypothetical protein
LFVQLLASKKKGRERKQDAVHVFERSQLLALLCLAERSRRRRQRQASKQAHWRDLNVFEVEEEEEGKIVYASGTAPSSTKTHPVFAELAAESKRKARHREREKKEQLLQ